MNAPQFEPADPIEPSPADSCSCPGCGQAVDLGGIAEPVVQCPYCQSQFFRPVPGEFDYVDGQDLEGEPGEPAVPQDEKELSELRIKQAITLRRSEYRTRTYWIVATAGCLFIAIQLIIYLVDDLKARRFKALDVAFILFAVGAMIGAEKLGRRVLEVQRKINADLLARELEEREAEKYEPDFSPLSDGSQQARNLARMVDEAEENGEGS